MGEGDFFMNRVKFFLGLFFILKNFAQPVLANLQIEHGAIQFIDNLAYVERYERNCLERSEDTEGRSVVSLCFSSNSGRYLRNFTNNPSEVDQCQSRVIRKILRLPHYQAPMPGGEAPIISLNNEITRPTLFLNTSPSLDPVSGGEILVLPSPANADWCNTSFQTDYFNKVKTLVTQTYQREVTGQFNATLNLINNIPENQILSVHCNQGGQLQAAVVEEHTEFWACGSEQLRRLLTQVDDIINNPANSNNVLLYSTIQNANFPQLQQKLNYLCREGFAFGLRGFNYRNRPVRTPNNLALESEEYALEAARQFGVDSSLFVDAFSVLQGLIYLKNIVYIERNPLQIAQQVGVEFKAHAGSKSFYTQMYVVTPNKEIVGIEDLDNGNN